VVIGCPIGPADVPGLWDRIRELLEDGAADAVICDVAGLVEPDVATIDALARLQLTARRSGCRVRLHRAHVELLELLALMGLGDVVPPATGLLEAEGQAEQRKQPGGVQEEADPRDAIPGEVEDLERPGLAATSRSGLVLPECR
jgi:ABC-type transporter Mla MlaB component